MCSILELNWNQRFRDKKTNLNICHHMLTSSTQLQSFHVVKRTRTSVRCPNRTNARATPILYCQICKLWDVVVAAVVVVASRILYLLYRLYSSPIGKNFSTPRNKTRREIPSLFYFASDWARMYWSVILSQLLISSSNPNLTSAINSNSNQSILTLTLFMHGNFIN